MDEYHNIHQQLVKELYSKNPDTIKIHGFVNGIGDLQTKIRLMTVDHIMESNRYLSKEQREDLMRFFMSGIDRDFRTPGFRKFHRNRDKTHEHMRRKLLKDSLDEIDNQ
jgi:hypothetical protein